MNQDPLLTRAIQKEREWENEMKCYSLQVDRKTFIITDKAPLEAKLYYQFNHQLKIKKRGKFLTESDVILDDGADEI